MQLRANGAYSFTANLYTPTAPECIIFHHFFIFFLKVIKLCRIVPLQNEATASNHNPGASL